MDTERITVNTGHYNVILFFMMLLYIHFFVLDILDKEHLKI